MCIYTRSSHRVTVRGETTEDSVSLIGDVIDVGAAPTPPCRTRAPPSNRTTWAQRQSRETGRELVHDVEPLSSGAGWVWTTRQMPGPRLTIRRSGVGRAAEALSRRVRWVRRSRTVNTSWRISSDALGTRTSEGHGRSRDLASEPGTWLRRPRHLASAPTHDRPGSTFAGPRAASGAGYNQPARKPADLTGSPAYGAALASEGRTRAPVRVPPSSREPTPPASFMHGYGKRFVLSSL